MAVFTAVPFDQFKAGVARGPADVTASLQRNVERTSPNERAKQQQDSRCNKSLFLYLSIEQCEQ